jgi:uncharacterized glyoxalase superfamily protein PhnB
MTELRWRAATVLGVQDVRAAVEFYCKKLEFACDPATGIFGGVVAAEPAVYAVLTKNGVDLHLQIRRRPRHPAGRESIETDLYLYVDDVDAYYARIKSRGVNVLRPFEPARNYGMRDFMLEDPDGNRLVIGSRK